MGMVIKTATFDDTKKLAHVESTLRADEVMSRLRSGTQS